MKKLIPVFLFLFSVAVNAQTLYVVSYEEKFPNRTNRC